MNPEAGWYRDPTAPEALRWWDGAKWTSTTAAPPNPDAPSLKTEAWRPADVSRRWGFPFDRPLTRDWVFYWTVIVMGLSIVAFAVNNVERGSATGVGFVVDAMIGLPLNFIFFVLPVASIRWLVRRGAGQRQDWRNGDSQVGEARAASNTDASLPGTPGPGSPSDAYYLNRAIAQLWAACPVWEPRLVRVLGRDAAAITLYPFTFAVFLIDAGQWWTYNVVSRDGSRLSPVQEPPGRMGIHEADTEHLVSTVVETTVVAYRNALRIEPDDEFYYSLTRDAAEDALGYLQPGER